MAEMEKMSTVHSSVTHILMGLLLFYCCRLLTKTFTHFFYSTIFFSKLFQYLQPSSVVWAIPTPEIYKWLRYGQYFILMVLSQVSLSNNKLFLSLCHCVLNDSATCSPSQHTHFLKCSSVLLHDMCQWILKYLFIIL